MKELVIEKSYSSPYVRFKAEEGNFLIEGRSILENPADFYNKIYIWLTEYFEKPQEKTTLTIKLEYLNSSSSKYITGLLRVFEQNFMDGRNIEVTWHYEKDDESIQELGQNYKNNLRLPLKLIEYKE